MSMREIERVTGLLSYYGRSYRYYGTKDNRDGEFIWTLEVVFGDKFKGVKVEAQTYESAKEKLINKFKLIEGRIK